MGGTSEKYDLSWQMHNEEALRAILELRARDSLLDTSLYCENQLFRVHGLVLAACSSYFERILVSLSGSSGGGGGAGGGRETIIALPKMNLDLLRLAVDFMYAGKVTVPSDDLVEFMDVAEMLEIRGLRSKKPQHAPPPPPPSSSSVLSPVPASKRVGVGVGVDVDDDDDEEERATISVSETDGVMDEDDDGECDGDGDDDDDDVVEDDVVAVGTVGVGTEPPSPEELLAMAAAAASTSTTAAAAAASNAATKDVTLVHQRPVGRGSKRRSNVVFLVNDDVSDAEKNDGGVSDLDQPSLPRRAKVERRDGLGGYGLSVGVGAGTGTGSRSSSRITARHAANSPASAPSSAANSEVSTPGYREELSLKDDFLELEGTDVDDEDDVAMISNGSLDDVPGGDQIPQNIPPILAGAEHIERVGFSIWRGQSQASSGRRLTYFCSMCDYVSEQKCNAMRHEIKHSQIRPYECNICGKAYTENRGLKRHRVSAHPEVTAAEDAAAAAAAAAASSVVVVVGSGSGSGQK